MNVKLGAEVGYAVRFDEKHSPQTRIKYMTDGMILREALLDRMLKQYNMLILDEVHERSINSDSLLALAKAILKQRSDFKLVVMSATLNVDQLSTYLATNNVVHIEGRSFPIEIYNLTENKEEMIV